MDMKWYYKVSIVLFAITLIAYIGVDLLIKRFVERSVKRIQVELQDRYRFEYDEIKVSFFQRNIILENFTFSTVNDSDLMVNKLDFSLERLHLKIDNYKDIISNGKLQISIAELNSPTIYSGLRTEINKEEVGKEAFDEDPQLNALQATDSLNKLLVKILLIEKFKIRNGKLDIYDLDNQNKKIFHSENVNISGDQLNIDFTASQLDDIMSATELIINLQSINSEELKKHELNVDDIQFTYSTNELLISGFSFRNIDSPELYSSKQKYRSPWVDINVDTILIKINPWHIYNKGVLYVKDVTISGVNATIYNDVTLALKPKHQDMPSRAIRDISFPLKIDRISVGNSNLKYLHKTEAASTGLFELDHIELIAQNITNIDYLMDMDPILKLDVKALLWNAGILKADFQINLKNEFDYIYAKGSLVNMDLQKTEYMIKPLYGVSISSGYLNKLSYELAMNENMGEGRLVFSYSDLKVDFKKDSLSSNDANAEQKSNKFLNFVANGAIKTNNIPSTNKYIPYGHMIYERSKDKAIFDLYWHSIQSGIMDIVIPDAFYSPKSSYNKKEKRKEKNREKSRN
jgi:hypothetical protein